MTLLISNDGPVRVISFNHASEANPFNREMQLAVTEAALSANADDSVRAVVFTGGPERMFSAGGDFSEVQRLSGGDDVDVWIDTFMDMYLSLLKINKPTLAAIDRVAIGLGFQVSLMLDWRVMADTAKLAMPELRHGIGGSVGGAILSSLFGVEEARATMLNALEFNAQESLNRRLVQQVAPQAELMKATMECAHDRASFPSKSYRATKQIITKPLVENLLNTAEASKKVHREAFKEQAMSGHVQNILSRSRREKSVA